MVSELPTFPKDLCTAIEQLLHQGVIAIVLEKEMVQAFYSKLFTVPIAKGGILDLKVPNTFLRVKKKFHMYPSGQLLFSSAQETICGHQGAYPKHLMSTRC